MFIILKNKFGTCYVEISNITIRDKENILRWIFELRSEKYKQFRGTVYSADEDAYCCLGVFGKVCNIPNELLVNHGYLNKDFTNVLTFTETIDDNSKQYTDSYEIQQWFARLNDEYTLSFTQIANLLEQFIQESEK